MRGKATIKEEGGKELNPLLQQKGGFGKQKTYMGAWVFLPVISFFRVEQPGRKPGSHFVDTRLLQTRNALKKTDILLNSSQTHRQHENVADEADTVHC